MTSIERTAYPQFERLTSARVLHVFFTPMARGPIVTGNLSDGRPGRPRIPQQGSDRVDMVARCAVRRGTRPVRAARRPPPRGMP